MYYLSHSLTSDIWNGSYQYYCFAGHSYLPTMGPFQSLGFHSGPGFWTSKMRYFVGLNYFDIANQYHFIFCILSCSDPSGDMVWFKISDLIGRVRNSCTDIL